MVPGGRPLIPIIYKYNVHNVLYFIVTEDAGSTKEKFQYLSKYPDKFSNVAICPVASTLLMSTLFGSVNEVASHEKTRKSNLAP